MISDEEILFTEVQHPGYLLCLSQPAYDRYKLAMLPGSTLIYDPLFVSLTELEGIKQIALHATETAVSLGRRQVANVVALGGLCAISAVTSRAAALQALLNRVPKDSKQLNQKALQVGAELAQKAVEGDII
jgi:2-oxoglutarate ferredoxin oxidoreductase subunit gamma